MVEQGSRGMQTGQPQQEVRRKPVPIGDGLSQSPIADLRQTRQIEEIVTTNKSVNHAKDDDDQQQKIEAEVRSFRQNVERASVGGGQVPSPGVPPDHAPCNHDGQSEAKHNVH